MIIMKPLALSILFIAILSSGNAFGSGTSKPSAPSTQSKRKASPQYRGGTRSQLSTDIVFDGAMVNGRYHSAGEAVSTVEADKLLNNLVGLRRNFRDRLTDERSRLNSLDTKSSR